MSQEHHHEHHERNEQANHELEVARAHKLEELRQEIETGAETATTRAEQAREIINKHEPVPNPEPTPENHQPQSGHRLKLDPRQNYADTMRSVQHRLSPLSRRFSRVIHTPVIEKTSEALEKTVARPSATLGATSTALVVGLIFYVTARTYGYMLSGSELLFSFIVGALIGILLEGAWRLFTHRR